MIPFAPLICPPPISSVQPGILSTDRQQIDRHRQPHHSQKQSQRQGLRRGMAARDLSAIERSYEVQMMKAGKDVQDDSRRNQRRAEPQRQAVAVLRGHHVKGLYLLQKRSESRHNKTKAHQGQSGADPRKKGALSGEIVAEPRFLRRWRGLFHDGLFRFLRDSTPRVLSLLTPAPRAYAACPARCAQPWRFWLPHPGPPPLRRRWCDCR